MYFSHVIVCRQLNTTSRPVSIGSNLGHLTCTSIRGLWSKWRQTKTVTSQNGDTKTSTSHNGDNPKWQQVKTATGQKNIN